MINTKKIGLGRRITVFFVALLLVVQAFSYVLIEAVHYRLSAAEQNQNLRNTEHTLRTSIQQLQHRLLSEARQIAQDPRLSADLLRTQQMEAVLALMAGHSLDGDPRWAYLIDAQGSTLHSVIASSGNRVVFPVLPTTEASRNTVPSREKKVEFLSGRSFAGLMLLPNGDVAIFAVAPLTQSGTETTVSLVLGERLGTAMIDQIAALTESQLAVTTRPIGGVQLSPRLNGVGSEWARIPESDLAALLKNSIALETKRAITMELDDHKVLAHATSIGLAYGSTTSEAQAKGSTGALLSTEVILLQTKQFQQDGSRLDAFRDLFAGLTLAGLLIFATGGHMLARRIALPAARLAQSADRMSRGDYSVEISIETQDEIGHLASSFKAMREAIASRERKVLEVAYRDPLTKLPNRARLMQKLNQRCVPAQQGKLALVMFGLDRFRAVNDALGYSVGDKILAEVGARIQKMSLKQSFVARFSGDSFVVAMPASEDVALRWAEMALGRLQEPHRVGDVAIDISASCGIAHWPAHAQTAEQLLRHAEQALEASKLKRCGVLLFDPRMHSKPEQHGQLTLLGELREALRLEQFELAWQPQVDLRSGQMAGVEGLIRWHHPERGILMPGDFLPFAEQTGMMRDLTRWVLRSGIAHAARWHREGYALRVSLNVTTGDLQRPELIAELGSLLTEQDLPPQLLCLELTEESLMENPEQSLDTMRRLSQLGVRLAIDDFGTGYSSLRYLQRLPAQELKIDRSFVMGLLTHQQDRSIVRAVVELAHQLNMEVTAEGVETVEHAKMLQTLHCEIGQGYVIAKPSHATVIDQLLARQTPLIQLGPPPAATRTDSRLPNVAPRRTPSDLPVDNVAA